MRRDRRTEGGTACASKAKRRPRKVGKGATRAGALPLLSWLESGSASADSSLPPPPLRIAARVWSQSTWLESHVASNFCAQESAPPRIIARRQATLRRTLSAMPTSSVVRTLALAFAALSGGAQAASLPPGPPSADGNQTGVDPPPPGPPPHPPPAPRPFRRPFRRCFRAGRETRPAACSRARRTSPRSRGAVYAVVAAALVVSRHRASCRTR